MVRLITFIGAILLTGCATVTDMIPSFWDDNEAKAAVDIKYTAQKINCQDNYQFMVYDLQDNIEWLIAYAESKGSKDLIRLTKPLQNTTDAFVKKVEAEKDVSLVYCELKRKIIVNQANTLSNAALGRY